MKTNNPEKFQAVDNSSNPIKVAFGQYGHVGMILVVQYNDGSVVIGQVVKSESKRGCAGDTTLTLECKDQCTRLISWRSGVLREIRPLKLSEVL
jgi:hypothetical protein